MSDQAEQPKPKHSKPRGKKNPLTVKQQIFTNELLSGNSQAKAYQVAYGRHDEVAASRLSHNPKVISHIRDALNARYPNLADDCSIVLRRFIEDEELKPETRMRAIEMLASYMGWKAPTQSQHLHAKVDVQKYKLPGSDT